MNNSICTLFDNILIDIHKFKSLHHIIENAEPLHSRLIPKIIAYCGLITIVEIGMVIILTKYLGRKNK